MITVSRNLQKHEVTPNYSLDHTEPPTHINFTQLQETFIEFLDVSEKTKQTYARAIKQFLSYIYDERVKQPTKKDVLAYKRQLKEEGKKPTTISSYIIAIRQLFNWTEEQGIYPNIARNVKGAKASKGHKKDYLTSDQAQHVLEMIVIQAEKQIKEAKDKKKPQTSIDRLELQKRRDFALVSLMLTTGLRTIEVARANIQDISIAGDSPALYIQGKGRESKDDFVKITPQIDYLIRDYLSLRENKSDNEPLFTSTAHNGAGKRLSTKSISGMVKKSLVNAGYDSDRLTAHSLRHTTATLNLLSGGSIEETQQLLRHESISTTMIYNHSLERAKNQSEQRLSDMLFDTKKDFTHASK